MKFFKPKFITDPRTGQRRYVSAEEQLRWFEKGIVFDAPFEEAPPETENKGDPDA